MPMEVPSSKSSSVASSPFSSPNVGALLKIRVISWSQETGLPVTIHVRVGDKIFNLHKHQLFSKSGYFKQKLNESTELELPENFPGGPDTFEMLALFLYGSSTMVDPFNVAALRCAAEFLEMTEEHCHGNLCERFDLYLNQVVLQSWDDTLIVLQKCQALLPWSEELLIIGRCIESLAFMACMEILDPERRRDQPVVALETLAGQHWSCETTKEIVSRELWIKDLIALPFGFFKRVIGSLRRQGMKERYVSPIVVFYANKWVISKKTCQFWENSGEIVKDCEAIHRVSLILQGVLDLLPLRDKASRYIPVGFYFALLSRSFEVGLKDDTRAKLKELIASLLHFARVEDFLVPKESVSFGVEVATMESIVSRYVSLNSDSDHSLSKARNSIIAELWDSYVLHISLDPEMGPERFIELIERVPICFRQNHDQLYAAMSNFLKAHPSISQEERGLVCKSLNCQKLSQEVCIEAVQNELMPLRLIVQALFVQQINTHQVFKESSDSFRYMSCGEYSGSLASSRCQFSKSLFTDGAELASRPLSVLLHREVETRTSPEFTRKEYESTSFRIQSLEQELMSLKRSLQQQNNPTEKEECPDSEKLMSLKKNRSLSKKSNPLGQVTNCIGSVNTSQRRCANRLLKIFHRLTLFGSKKTNRKPSVSGQRSKPV